MSGTSLDGVDAALVRVSGSRRDTKAALVSFVTLPFPNDLRARVLAVSHGEGNAETVSRLNFALGALFAGAGEAVVRKANVSGEDVDLVASHGQTISHTVRALTAATLQIGEPAVIAVRLNVPVVSDFRTADVALGGQGAPLVPYADWCLLTHPTRARAVQNIGGIGNVTFLPPNAAPNQVIGFDTGPGNLLIDQAAQWATGGRLRFDENARLAKQGHVRGDLLAWLMTHPFLAATPPKSAGREEFGEAFWRAFSDRVTSSAPTCRPFDVVATLTAFTAATIAEAYRRFLPSVPDEVILGGGGARNPLLVEMLGTRLAPARVLSHEDVGLNGDAKEAIAFAVLANETLLGNPSNLPSVTGASRPAVLGKLTLP
jgi:anhydro-N-acetylmuramic acid kinase